MATERTQAQVLALIQEAVSTPASVRLTGNQWKRLTSVIEPKVGGFGTKVATSLRQKLVASDGEGDALSEAEAKLAISLMKVASAQATAAYLKTYTWECEPLQNKGGWMIPIFKSGDHMLARNYRGIMMLNTLSKGFHAWTRKRLMDHISAIRLPTQLGGFQHQQAQFGPQCIQSVARICAAKKLSHGCLFVDVRGAYHFLVKNGSSG